MFQDLTTMGYVVINCPVIHHVGAITYAAYYINMEYIKWQLNIISYA
jgi:hypothetical protein